MPVSSLEIATTGTWLGGRAEIRGVTHDDALTLQDGDLLLLIVIGTIVAVLLMREYNHLLLDSLSPPLAGVAGASSVYLEYFFAMLLTLADRKSVV